MPTPLAALDPDGVYPLDGLWDEAFERSGAPRRPYADLLERLEGEELSALSAAVRAELRWRGVAFDGRPFLVDPVPRIFEAEEWDLLGRGLAQRVRALQEFTADVYGDQRIVAAGVVPARVIQTADQFEPLMMGVDVPDWAYCPVAGLDVVRGIDGTLRVLEDNLRTPSGLSYAWAARSAADLHLPGKAPEGRRSLDPAVEALRLALRRAAPGGEGFTILLSDGSSNSAWYEHRALARRLGLPIATPGDLHLRAGRVCVLAAGGSRPVDVVYRRTDEDRLQDRDGRPTWLADMLLEPVRTGQLAVVNAFGSGVADDKLVHAYVEEMVRFYLGEEPLVESVPTFDLGEPERRAEALERMDDLVVKPRTGHGGAGIVICPHASHEDRALAASRIIEQPESWIAQETVWLSRLPTVQGSRLEPRHVDLRAFVVSAGGERTVVPGGLSRVALDAGALLVNSSQNGGGKDTWVLS